MSNLVGNPMDRCLLGHRTEYKSLSAQSMVNGAE